MRHHDDHDPNWTNHMIPIWKFPSFDRITISFVLSFLVFALSSEQPPGYPRRRPLRPPPLDLMGVSSPLPLPLSPSPHPCWRSHHGRRLPPSLSPRSPDDHITSSTLYETTSVRLSPHREHALCSPHNPPVRLSESSRATSRISHHRTITASILNCSAC